MSKKFVRLCPVKWDAKIGKYTEENHEVLINTNQIVDIIIQPMIIKINLSYVNEGAYWLARIKDLKKFRGYYDL